MTKRIRRRKADGLNRPFEQARRRRATQDLEASRLLDIVAADYSVSVDELLLPTRCRAEVARARMVAMYLCCVALGRNPATVGRLLGRDRTTASYACGKMEDLRDDPVFEARMLRLEETISSIIADELVEERRYAGR